MTLKSLQGTKGNCKGLQRYLEKDGRSLACDFSPLIGDRQNWGKDMDNARLYADKNKGRKYYHFIISPDPKDNPTLDTVRGLAVAWATENYPDGQWVIDYHNDNKRNVLHAHIALNAYSPVSHQKIHRTNGKIKKEARSLNRLKAEAGLSVLPDIKLAHNMGVQDRVLSKAEMEMQAKGIATWKSKLWDAIDQAAPLSSNFEQFKSTLQGLGVDVYINKRGQLVYTPPAQWKGYPCKDIKLGKLYGLEHLNKVFVADLGATLKQWNKTPQPKAVPAPKISMPKKISYADLISKRAKPLYKQTNLRNLGNTIATLSAQNVSSFADLNLKLDEINESISLANAGIAAAKEKQTFVDLACDQVAVLKRYKRIWGLYSDTSKKERTELSARYPETIEACLDAAEYLSDRGLETQADIDGIERLAAENAALLDSLQARLIQASAAYKSLNSATKMIAQIDRYRESTLKPKKSAVHSEKAIKPTSIETMSVLARGLGKNALEVQVSDSDLDRKQVSALQNSQRHRVLNVDVIKQDRTQQEIQHTPKNKVR